MVAAGEGVVLTLICLSFCLSAFSKNHSVKTKITKNYTQLHTSVHRQEYFKKIFISLFCIHTIRLRWTAQNWNSFGGIQQLYVTWKWGWQRGDGKGKRGKWEFLKGRKAGEINRNYATILNISQSKKGQEKEPRKKKGWEVHTHTHPTWKVPWHNRWETQTYRFGCRRWGEGRSRWKSAPLSWSLGNVPVFY